MLYKGGYVKCHVCGHQIDCNYEESKRYVSCPRCDRISETLNNLVDPETFDWLIDLINNKLDDHVDHSHTGGY